MKILTPIYHTMRLFGLLVSYNIIFIACVGSSQESFAPTSRMNPTKNPSLEPTLFIETPERIVGSEEIKFTLMRTSKIHLQELNISLISNNQAVFQLIKTNGESGGTNAKLAEVTNYNGRYQEDMTLPIKMKLNQENGEKESMVTITLQQAGHVLAKKDIHWVKDGINISLQADSLIVSDQNKITLTLANIANKSVNLEQVLIDAKCTNFGINFMLENVPSEKTNTSLDQVTRLKELGSHLNTQVIIRPYQPFANQIAVGLKVILLEKQAGDKDPQPIASIPLVFYTHKLLQIKKEIYQLIGEQGEQLDSLQNGIAHDMAWLITCLAKLEKGVEMYGQLLDQLTAVQRSDASFTPLISNLSYHHNRQRQKWQAIIKRIQELIQLDEATQKSKALQEELAKIPNIIQEKVVLAKHTPNIKDMTDMLLADYTRELPIEQQSIDGLRAYTEHIVQEFNSIENVLKLQNRMLDVNPSIITDQAQAIEGQTQSCLKEGFEKYRLMLLQQQNPPATQADLKEQASRNQLLNQLALQVSTLATWTKYIRDKQDENSIEENTLYIVQGYEKIASQALILAQAYFKDINYQGSVSKCADLVVGIATEAMFLAQVYNKEAMQTSANHTGKAAIEIYKILEKLEQNKKLPLNHHIKSENGNFQVWPSELAALRKMFKPQEKKS